MFGSNGEKLGKIVDIMLEKVSGKATYALMSFDGFFGAGARFYPLPWSMLSYSPEKQGYVARIDHDQLERSPHVKDPEIQNEIQWREAIHDYYQAEPYWM